MGSSPIGAEHAQIGDILASIGARIGVILGGIVDILDLCGIAAPGRVAKAPEKSDYWNLRPRTISFPA